MKISRCFNTILFGCVLLSGCKTAEERKLDKEASTMRFHLEVNSGGNPRAISVPVYRKNPVRISVDQNPVLDEGSLEKAEVVEFMGSHAIQLQFNPHGRMVLEATTTANRGKRLAIFSQFTEGRWLAAPRLNQRISNGFFTFTPDADREETERIVRGLNNLIEKIEKRNRF